MAFYKGFTNRKKLRSLGLGVFVLFAATIVSFLSLISIELSVAVFTLSSVAFIVLFERVRRDQWEQAVDFKIKRLNQKHDALSQEMTRHRENTTNNIRKDAISYKNIVTQTRAQTQIKKNQKPKPLKPANTNPYFPKEELTKPQPAIRIIEDDTLSDMVVEELTTHAVRKERIDIFMQPIMRLPKRERKFYEIFSRVRAKSGVYIPAKRYLTLAEKNNQMGEIDCMLLSQCLTLLMATSNAQNAPSFFINVTARTLKHKLFMEMLLTFLSKNRVMAKRLVFEMKQAEFHALPVPVLQIMRGLAKLGCAFSLDHVTNLDEDITDLQRFNIRYLKADARIFAKAVYEERQYKALMKQKRVLEGNGIGLIAEKIEDEAMMRKLMDYGFYYAQGYLFGRPDLQRTFAEDLKFKNYS